VAALETPLVKENGVVKKLQFSLFFGQKPCYGTSRPQLNRFRGEMKDELD